jgi:hypothetical protein
MTEKKHPLETSIKLSEAYAQCYRDYISPYRVGLNVRGFSHSDYSKLMKKHKNYFYTKKFGSRGDIKYKSKVIPLMEIISSKINLSTNEKSRLKRLLDLKMFRSCISKETGCINHKDILYFVSLIVMLEGCKDEYKEFLNNRGVRFLSRNQLRRKLKTLEKEFIPELYVQASEKQFKEKDKMIKEFNNFSEETKEKLIMLNPDCFRYLDLMKYSILLAEAHRTK